MKKRCEVILTAIVGMSIIQLELITGEDDMCASIATVNPLNIVWIRKPPYAINISNDSCIGHWICSEIISCLNGQNASLTTHRVASESDMNELMKLNEAQIAFPASMPSDSEDIEEDSEFESIVFLEDYYDHDYFGFEYIIKQVDVFSIVIGEVAKSWLWLATILVLSAIAGITVWILVSTETLSLPLKFNGLTSPSIQPRIHLSIHPSSHPE